jgi:hypothetical protein
MMIKNLPVEFEGVHLLVTLDKAGMDVRAIYDVQIPGCAMDYEKWIKLFNRIGDWRTNGCPIGEDVE